jgi:hypothetical protein
MVQANRISMNDPTLQTICIPVPAPVRMRKRLIWVCSGVLFFVLACVGVALYLDWQNERELREAEAEADRLDPGWRLQDLEGGHPAVPDTENGALQLLAAARLLPAFWPAPPPPATDSKLEDRLLELAPQIRPGKKLLDAVQNAMKQALPALGKARRLADYPRGHYVIAWSPDFIGTSVSHLEQVFRIKRLLYFDAVVSAEHEDVNGVVQSCVAALNASRSIGDEPFLMSQIIRAHCQLTAERGVERLLAQGEPSEATLKKLQLELEDEAAQPLLLRALRSYRANVHQALVALKAGRVNRRGLFVANPYGLPDQALNLNDAFRARACHPAYLRYLNELVKIGKLPPEQQGLRLEELKLPRLQKPTISFILEVSDADLRGVHRMFLSTLALLRCAVTGLAVERYRRDTGEWPESLADLVPLYLREGQRDPFDGAALRYRRLEHGVVIYSVGPDGKDHGGQLTRDLQKLDGADLGFQLWGPSKRRQPAATDLDGVPEQVPPAMSMSGRPLRGPLPG